MSKVMKISFAFFFLFFSSLFAFEELNKNNFDKKVENKKVILDFYASW